ncbi:MAG: helix-turn-helix transcriptional regulator, partial [Mycolicibacterium sp.]|nr:helix-turn-helix transcriptional regulator [Mycolicibacterium sp.]
MQAQGMWSAGGADDKERFLADLRALRDTAGVEFEELAARAHYPSSVLKEAEHGPSLPSLPILAAYVRACDGDVPEWEERWRRLGVESRADPGLPVRPAGASPAAVAGARAGVSVAPPDAYDPERIKAALRGSHGRSDAGAPGTVSRTAPRRVEPDTEEPTTAEPRIP